MNYKSLGKRLRSERVKQNFTQDSLSESIGISSSYLGQIERGERKTSLETLVRLANCLGVSINYLLGDSVVIKDEAFVVEFVELINGTTYQQKSQAIDLVRTLLTQEEDSSK